MSPLSKDPQSKDSGPKVTAIVVNFNSADEVCTLLVSLDFLALPLIKTIIIDNASSDDSIQRLEGAIVQGRHVLIARAENLGFAAGVNLGVRRAFEGGADYVWILNPDLVVEPDSLSKLIQPLEAAGGWGAAGPKILYPDNRIWAAGGFVDFSRLTTEMRGHGEEDVGQYNEGGICDYIPGCALLVSRKTFEEVGPFSEDYFLYFEETDWCRRAQRAGVDLFYVPASKVFHDFRDEKLAEPLVTYYYNRNRRLFFSRYGSPIVRLRVYAETLLLKYPEARRALREAPDEKSRLIFEAHRRSCADFLMGRLGYRHEGLVQ